MGLVILRYICELFLPLNKALFLKLMISNGLTKRGAGARKIRRTTFGNIKEGSKNFAYVDMKRALKSYTHVKIRGLSNYASID